MPRGIYERKPKSSEGQYDLTVSMNGESFACKTDDIKAALQYFKPEQVHTEMYINIKKGTADFLKRFTLPNARKLFRDEEYLDLFINSYTSLYG